MVHAFMCTVLYNTPLLNKIHNPHIYSAGAFQPQPILSSKAISRDASGSMSRNASRPSGTPFPVQVVSSDPSTQGSPTQSIRNKTLPISIYREASKASSRSRDQTEKLKLDSAGKLLLWCI